MLSFSIKKRKLQEVTLFFGVDFLFRLQTVLAPGTLQLVAVGVTTPETVGGAFGALQAPNHRRDVHMAISGFKLLGWIGYTMFGS